MKKLTLIAAIFLIPTVGMAHGDLIETIKLAVDKTLTMFEAEPDSTKDIFNGIKAWPSGSKVSLKIYLKEKDPFAYSCEMNHSGGADELVCTKN